MALAVLLPMLASLLVLFASRFSFLGSSYVRLLGRQEAITGNCHIRIAFAPNKPETAELLSRMAGDMTVHMEQRSYRGDCFDLVLNKQYVSQQQVQRRLLTPDEAMRLPDDEELVFVAGHPPIRARKIRYFEDLTLSSRAGTTIAQG